MGTLAAGTRVVMLGGKGLDERRVSVLRLFLFCSRLCLGEEAINLNSLLGSTGPAFFHPVTVRASFPWLVNGSEGGLLLLW